MQILLSRQFLILWAACLLALPWSLRAQDPVVSGIRAAQRAGTHLVDIYYHLAAGGPCTVSVVVSDNGGTSYDVPVLTLTGAVGPGVAPGTDRHFVWNAGTDWPGQFSTQCQVRITADDGAAPPAPPAPPAPAGMALIPAGEFQMGDTFGEGNPEERPVHAVFVSGFYLDRFEVTKALWDEVKGWGVGRGYGFENLGAGKAADHPVQNITWYDAVKWCNARSEKEGLTPCYYTDPAQKLIYKTGSKNLANAAVKWAANGYRLPTEAEWEKAARGGLKGKRFPWGDTVTHSQANYWNYWENNRPYYAYDVSPTRGFHPQYAVGREPWTSPVDSFAANGYGLHDLAGNVWEWCWDGWDDSWYRQSGATADNSRGPAFVGARVLRGGVWNLSAVGLRCAIRSYSTPTAAFDVIGFRCVRGL